MDERRQQELNKWFTASYEELSDHAAWRSTALELDTIMFRLAAALQHCPAKANTPAKFREWSRAEIERIAADVRIYERANELSVADVLTLSGSKKDRKNTRPFVYEVHGNSAFIRMQDGAGTPLVWIVPSDWLPVAKKLWPCHIRHTKTGPYVSKKVRKQRLDGSWGQFDLPIHHVFVNCGYRDVVEAVNRNFLDYSDGNLRKRATGAAGDVYADPTRLVPLDAVSHRVSGWDILTNGWKPAISTRVPQLDS